jgi:arylsulfatase
MPLLKGKIKSTNDTLFWEHQGGRALRIGDWKIAALNNKEWELFDLSIDRTESNDLSKHLPEKVKAMEQVWKSEWKRIYSEE